MFRYKYFTFPTVCGPGGEGYFIYHWINLGLTQFKKRNSIFIDSKVAHPFILQGAWGSMTFILAGLLGCGTLCASSFWEKPLYDKHYVVISS
jgi:hypothetical protein